jgi:hypothetical protein
MPNVSPIHISNFKIHNEFQPLSQTLPMLKVSHEMHWLPISSLTKYVAHLESVPANELLLLQIPPVLHLLINLQVLPEVENWQPQPTVHCSCCLVAMQLD